MGICTRQDGRMLGEHSNLWGTLLGTPVQHCWTYVQVKISGQLISLHIFFRYFAAGAHRGTRGVHASGVDFVQLTVGRATVKGPSGGTCFRCTKVWDTWCKNSWRSLPPDRANTWPKTGVVGIMVHLVARMNIFQVISSDFSPKRGSLELQLHPLKLT